jgi:hypothetical protein
MYFIFDANDNPVGNPKGYKTVARASRVVNNPRTKAYKAIWATFDACRRANPNHTRINRITAEEARP